MLAALWKISHCLGSLVRERVSHQQRGRTHYATPRTLVDHEAPGSLPMGGLAAHLRGLKYCCWVYDTPISTIKEVCTWCPGM